MSTQSVSHDTLPNSVPKLDPRGENWAIFKIRFQNAMEAKEKWAHFDDQQKRPTDAAEAAEWDKNERMAKYMLTQRLPDSTVVRIQKCKNVAEQWSANVKEYTEKGESAQTEMRRDFMETKCGASVDVRQFLSDLRTRKEEIIACGVNVDNDDYRVTIIRAIPKDLADFASSTLSAARLINPTKPVNPDNLITQISEEYDRRRARAPKNPPNQKSNRRSGGDDVALAATPAKKGQGLTRGTCWNCGEKGHFKHQCPKPPKPKKNDGAAAGKSSAPAGSANVVIDDEADGAWAIFEMAESDVDDLPSLASVSDDESDIESDSPVIVDDWLSEAEDCAFDVFAKACSVDSEASDDDDDLSGDEGLVAGASDETLAPRIALLDSGSTCHISPHRDQFSNF